MPITLDPVAVYDNYGAPQYGALAQPEGLIFHTPENPSIYLSSAVAVTTWQASPGNSSGGSYHGVLACRDGTDPADYRNWVMVRSVPWNRIAGGVTSKRTNPPWDPVGWLDDLLSSAATYDPNKYHHQIALSGRAAWYRGTPISTWRGAVVRAAQWCRILEVAYRYNCVLSEHTNWQSNRSDATGYLADAVLEEYLRQMDGGGAVPSPSPAPVDYAGSVSAFGTRYPSYVHSAADALGWVNRNIRRLRDEGVL